MRLTLSVIKADVGSVGGHTKPSARMIASVEDEVAKAIDKGLLIDGFVGHTGDDIAIIMTHTRGEGSAEVHQFAWKTFLAATSVAKISGLYGAGQDLLVDAPSGNIRGAGPAVAELSFDHSLSGARPAESFMVLAADKCGPGAYNLPIYLAFADPMYCAGLMLPPMIKGFRFHVIDMDNTAGDSIIELDAPADSYQIAALLATTSALASTASCREPTARSPPLFRRSAFTRSRASTLARMIRSRSSATREFSRRPRRSSRPLPRRTSWAAMRAART